MFSKLKSIRWDHFDILELPYAGVDLSIFILLPVNGIEDAEKYFQIFNLKEVIAELSIKSNYWTKVTMPRFTVSFDWNDLSEVMKTSGVESLFDKQSATPPSQASPGVSELPRAAASSDQWLSIDRTLHQRVTDPACSANPRA